MAVSTPLLIRKKPSAVRSPLWMNGLVALVDVAREELRAVRVGARDEDGRDARDVGGEARGDQGANELRSWG